MPFAAGMMSTRQRSCANTTGFPGRFQNLTTYGQVAREYSEKELQIIDPTSVILIDEADRLRWQVAPRKIRTRPGSCRGGQIRASNGDPSPRRNARQEACAAHHAA